jgi:hypothetical protein
MNLDRIRHWFQRPLRKNPDVFRATGLACLPNFKRNATTAELLRELALLAEQHPEQFAKWVLVYCEDNDKRFMVRYQCGAETRTSDSFGVLAAGQQHIWESSRR